MRAVFGRNRRLRDRVDHLEEDLVLLSRVNRFWRQAGSSYEELARAYAPPAEYERARDEVERLRPKQEA